MSLEMTRSVESPGCGWSGVCEPLPSCAHPDGTLCWQCCKATGREAGSTANTASIRILALTCVAVRSGECVVLHCVQSELVSKWTLMPARIT